MNRQKYIHNPDYREGYDDGVKEAKMTVISNTVSDIEAIIKYCEQFRDKMKGFVEEGAE